LFICFSFLNLERDKDTASDLRTKGVFVQANFRRAAGDVINRKDIKTQRNVFPVALGVEALRGSRYDVLFLGVDAQFR